MKTLEIYNIIEQYNQSFRDNNQYYPAKVNFYIQFNIKKLQNIANLIEQVRIETIQHYGEQINNTSYSIPKDKIEIVNRELQNLLEEEQEVTIKKIKLSDLEGLEFTPAQMQALMFMIEE